MIWVKFINRKSGIRQLHWGKDLLESFPFPCMEIFPRRHPRIVRFQSWNKKSIMVVQTGQSSIKLRAWEPWQLFILPFGKKFDALDIKLLDRVFRIFHWISSFFECPTFTCQQKFCHFRSWNIFHDNSVKNCFSIWIFCYNISTESIDVVTGYMTF